MPTDIEKAESVQELQPFDRGEGIVGKYRRGTYTTAPISWVKILNPSYSQERGRREMFENFRERGEHIAVQEARE